MLPLLNDETLVACVERCGSVSVLSALARRHGVSGPLDSQNITRRFYRPTSHNWGFANKDDLAKVKTTYLIVRHPIHRFASARALLRDTNASAPRDLTNYLVWAKYASNPHSLSTTRVVSHLPGKIIALQIENAGEWGPELGLTIGCANVETYPKNETYKFTANQRDLFMEVYGEDFELGGYDRPKTVQEFNKEANK